jgi:molybdopterin synthase catalytic subunit
MMSPRILVQEAPFDLAAESAALTAAREDVGAVASFVGLCRADDGLAALVLEHYPGMTERAIAGIATEASGRWPLTGCTVVHRVGRLRPGEPIVLVLTASSHRAAALESCAFLIDWLKTGAPFWKREEFADGRGERWVEAKAEDDAAASRWIARDAGSAAA